MSRVRRPSLTLRLTLLFAAVSTTVLLALGVLVGTSVEAHFEEDDLEMLRGKLELTRHALEHASPGALRNQIAHTLSDALIGHHDIAVMVLDHTGGTLFSSPHASFPPALLTNAGHELHPTRWSDAAGRPWRGFAVRADDLADQPSITIALATDISHHEHFMSGFRRSLWLAVALAAALTGLLGWGAVRRGLAPLRDIQQEAARINAQRLESRIATHTVPAELTPLVNTLNTMLAGLEDAFARLTAFSSDIAHELRTPVSNLLTQTQVTLAKARTLAEYEEVLAANSEELERLTRMISDMLFLAKSENHLMLPHVEPLELALEARRLCDFYEALAEEQGVTLSCQGSAQLQGDRLMLDRALSNLLSNAIRHTPRGGKVLIRIDDTGSNEVLVSIENTGEDIPPGHLPRLFDRFYRVDASRQRAGGGLGLGLAMTRAITRAHGGEVRVQSAAGHTCFTLHLPQTATPPSPRAADI